MNISKLIVRLLKKFIRKSYVLEEIERFKQEASMYTVADIHYENTHNDNIHDIESFMQEDYIERKIPIISKEQTGKIKIRILSEILNLTIKEVEDNIIFVDSFKGEEIIHLEIALKIQGRLKLLRSKIGYLRTKISNHKEKLMALKYIDEKYIENMEEELANKFSIIKDKIAEIELESVLGLLKDELVNDGELLSIREAIKDLNKQKMLGIIHYRDYREGILKEGLNLLDKVDEFYEVRLQRN